MASRVDVANLREQLERKLQERQARDGGLCPVREELFSQCFDEIIRQVTLSEPERGLLLLRVRDELKMSIQAYSTLYQSSVTFAMRKQLIAEHGMDKLQAEIRDQEDQKVRNENRVLELKTKLEEIETRNKERVQFEEERMKTEREFILQQKESLGLFLETIKESRNWISVSLSERCCKLVVAHCVRPAMHL